MSGFLFGGLELNYSRDREYWLMAQVNRSEEAKEVNIKINRYIILWPFHHTVEKLKLKAYRSQNDTLIVEY
ncbi:unnamed protein product [Caretta caretta]